MVEYIHLNQDEFKEWIDKKLNLDLIADKAIEFIKQDYIDSLNYDGSPMKALLNKSILQKTKMGSGTPDKPLIRTGQTMNSNIKTRLNDREIEITVSDKARGKITTNQILSFQKAMNRTPFGLSPKFNQWLKDYINNV